MNKSIELSINALEELSTATTNTRAVDLAAKLGTTRAFLEQITQRLRKANLIQVKRGPGGGIVPHTKGTVSVLEIIQVFKKDKPPGERASDKLTAELNVFLSNKKI